MVLLYNLEIVRHVMAAPSIVMIFEKKTFKSYGWAFDEILTQYFEPYGNMAAYDLTKK